MLNFMVNAEGGLTTAGYAICIVLGIVVFGIALFFAGKNSEKNKMSAKQLACCAMAMALAFITSYIKIFSLPWGGSVTLCSMLFIVLVANWYGVRTGILVGFTYGMLQFLQEPYVLSLFQVCCDYMPDNFPKSLAAVYPIAYNYSFLLAEGLITIVIISIPAVQKALGRVKKIAVE